MELTKNILNIGITFSEGISYFKTDNRKNIFEEIITVQAIEEDSNISDEYKQKLISIINSNMNPFEKRIYVMRALDREKEFSSKIALILRSKLPRMEMVKSILKIFRDYYIKSDVLKKDFGEVLTPIKMVSNMISEIDDEFWRSPYDESGNIKTVLETSNGSGIFLWYVICKFMYGLSNHFPNENERYKFIVENMIYACELQKSKMFNWLCIADLYDEHDLNVYCGSFLENGFDNHMKDVWNIDRFSLILSNPPYQEMDGGAKASAKPIYNLFTLKSIKISEKVLFITPSRWFAGGKGLDSYRKFMMESNKIRLIKHFDDASEIFGNSVEIKGGVSYFLFDNSYNGECLFNNNKLKLSNFDIIITNNSYQSLIDKILLSNKFIDSICLGRGDNVFGIQTNDVRLTDDNNDDNILCHVSIQKGRKKYINRNLVKNIHKSTSHKVITVEAATKGGEGFGNIYVANPNEVLNGSYIFFITNSIQESESLKSYLTTKFANKLLSLRKISQHIKPDTLKWIPMVPFDREWTDEQLFEYFNLSEEEKKLIL